MSKAIIQGAITVLLFLATWFALARIDWTTRFKIKQVTDKTEEKLGSLFWEVFRKAEKEIKTPLVVTTTDSLTSLICKANHIPRGAIKVHILAKNEINAFALPGGHLIVYSGLIASAENAEELCGVISHEMAHITLNHVMKKLIKEVGLSALISMTNGNGGTEIIKATAKILSSTAFDRSLEKAADLKAVDYLVQAGIRPEPFADFLYRLAEKENGPNTHLAWLSTHPDSRERAGYILAYSRPKKKNFLPILPAKTWSRLKAELTIAP